jgi:hypothetical protein
MSTNSKKKRTKPAKEASVNSAVASKRSPIPAKPRHPVADNATKHGHWPREAALTRVGFDGIDKRTTGGRIFFERREQLIADLGGRDALSQIQHDMIERYMRFCVLIDSIDNWLFRQNSLVNKRKRCLYPIVRERAALEDSANRLAQTIGIERKAKAVPDLHDYIREHDRRKQEQQQQSNGITNGMENEQ